VDPNQKYHLPALRNIAIWGGTPILLKLPGASAPPRRKKVPPRWDKCRIGLKIIGVPSSPHYTTFVMPEFASSSGRHNLVHHFNEDGEGGATPRLHVCTATDQLPPSPITSIGQSQVVLAAADLHSREKTLQLACLYVCGLTKFHDSRWSYPCRNGDSPSGGHT
jgi:hypothetical protein